MTKNELPSQAELRQLFNYCELTGVFRYAEKTCRKVVVGKVAGALKNGYVRIYINRIGYLAHRLAWVYSHGREPSDCLDHINGNRSDNRITNLREASIAENNQNRVPFKKNSSGHQGVNWDASSSKWRAKVYLKGKCIDLGHFSDKEDAAKAYRDEKQRIHPFQTQIQ